MQIEDQSPIASNTLHAGEFVSATCEFYFVFMIKPWRVQLTPDRAIGRRRRFSAVGSISATVDDHRAISDRSKREDAASCSKESARRCAWSIVDVIRPEPGRSASMGVRHNPVSDFQERDKSENCDQRPCRDRTAELCSGSQASKCAGGISPGWPRTMSAVLEHEPIPVGSEPRFITLSKWRRIVQVCHGDFFGMRTFYVLGDLGVLGMS